MPHFSNVTHYERWRNYQDLKHELCEVWLSCHSERPNHRERKLIFQFEDETHPKGTPQGGGKMYLHQGEQVLPQPGDLRDTQGGC